MSAYTTHVTRLLTGALTLLLCVQVTTARPRGPGFDDHDGRRASARVERQLRKHLIPPHMLMRHMDELELTPAQREELKTIIKSAQSQMVDLRFELKGASTALIDGVKDPSVTEVEVLKRADALMELEAKQKRARLQAALKIRALLTPAQKQKAQELKSKARERFKEGKGERGRRGRWGRRGRRHHDRAHKRGPHPDKDTGCEGGACGAHLE